MKVETYSLEELSKHYEHTQSDVSKYVREADYNKVVEQNAELGAQVGKIQTFIRMAAEKWKDCQELEPTFLTLLRVANDQPEEALRQIQADAVDALELNEYDAGFLNDFGGGNVGWWQDYIRSELGSAYEFYQSQIEHHAIQILQGGV